MQTIKGPAVFLAQFAADEAPFNTLPAIAEWAAGKGFKGGQIPTCDSRVIDMKQAAELDAECDDVLETLARNRLALTAITSHFPGQLLVWARNRPGAARI